jgi:hypothetical protein
MGSFLRRLTGLRQILGFRETGGTKAGYPAGLRQDLGFLCGVLESLLPEVFEPVG